MNYSELWYPIQHPIYSLVPYPLSHVLLTTVMEKELLPPMDCGLSHEICNSLWKIKHELYLQARS